MKKKYVYLIIVLILISSVFIYKQTKGEVFLEKTVTKIGNNNVVDDSNIPKDFIDTIERLYLIAENNGWSKPDIYVRRTDENIFLVTLTSEVYDDNTNGHLGSNGAKLEINMDRYYFTWQIESFKVWDHFFEEK